MRQLPDWTDALVLATQDITPTVREFTLQARAGAPLAAPGAHLQVQVLVNGKAQTRSYSLVNASDAPHYRIAVKRLPEGRGGSLAMWRLQVGDRLRISEPRNLFSLDLSAPAYLLVAGGIGVTPLVQMAHTLARRSAPVQMLMGARTEDELAFAPVLRATLGARFITFCASKGQTIDFNSAIEDLAPGGQLYLCGPAPMLDAARRAWEQAGRPVADLRYETFGSSGRLAPQAFRALIPRQQLDITVPVDTSLLDAIERAGVQALSNCRRGECGLCAMDILALDGEVDHRDVFLSDQEKRENKRICVCVSRVVGTVTLDCAYRPEY